MSIEYNTWNEFNTTFINIAQSDCRYGMILNENEVEMNERQQNYSRQNRNIHSKQFMKLIESEE